MRKSERKPSPQPALAVTPGAPLTSEDDTAVMEAAGTSAFSATREREAGYALARDELAAAERTLQRSMKNGRYVITSSVIDGLGREVALAEERSSLGFLRRVRVVLVPHDHPDHFELKQALRREGAIIASFHHPRLPHLLGGGEEAVGAYMIYDYVEGTPLDRVLAALARRRAALPLDIAAPIVLEALRAVHQAHGSEARGVVFRGLSTRDVVVSHAGDVHVTRIHFPGRQQASQYRAASDEPRSHLAPECREDGLGSPRSDVYSLGLILAELLLGHAPAALPTEDALARILHREGVSEGLVHIILRAVAPRPEARYESARAMADALESWLAETGHSSSPSLLERFFVAHQLHDDAKPPRSPHGVTGTQGVDVPPLRLTRGRSVFVHGQEQRRGGVAFEETLIPKSSKSRLRPPRRSSSRSDLSATLGRAPTAALPTAREKPSTPELPLQSLGSQLCEIAVEHRRPRGISALTLARTDRSRRLRRVARNTPGAKAEARRPKEAPRSRALVVVVLLLAVAAGFGIQTYRTHATEAAPVEASASR